MITETAVIILTLNEEKNILRTLDRLSEFGSVFVVDSGSTDKTLSICAAANRPVVQFSWDGKYPKKKQWALDNVATEHDWILLLDADEYPDDVLVDEIRTLSQLSANIGAFDVPLSYVFAGRRLKYGHQVVKRSLLRRSACRFPDVQDHDAPGIREVEGHYQPQTSDAVGRSAGRIIHDDQDPLRDWIARHNNYSDWEAYLMLEPRLRQQVNENRTTRGRVFAKMPLKAIVFFLYSYLLKVGFLDGRAGFDYAIGLAFYYWQIGAKRRELGLSSQ